MADPLEYIEINDFSPGIWSDAHAAIVPTGGSISEFPEVGDGIRGYMAGNGAATIENTYGCRADKNGALVPLPTPFAGETEEGIPTDDYGTDWRPSNRDAAYISDVEVSTHSFFVAASSVDAEPWGGDNYSIFVNYGFFMDESGDGTVNGYRPYLLGREYRLNLPNEPKKDFSFSRWFPEVVSNFDFAVLPSGSLCQGHLDRFAQPNVINAFGLLFDISEMTSTIVTLISQLPTSNPSFSFMRSYTIAIDATEEAWLTQVNAAPGNNGTTHKPSIYSPSLLADFPWHVAIGMAYGEPQYNPEDILGTPAPENEWRWHARDASLAGSTLDNIPQSPHLMIGYQGRIVMADLASAGPDISTFYEPAAALDEPQKIARDLLWYSQYGLPIGDVYTPEGAGTEHMRQYTPIIVGEDNPSRIGILGVTTADELFVVKSYGGAVLIRGDLNNPTVRRIPHAEPTFGVSSKGVATPLGFIYGTRTGVFVFDGGDTTQKLSQQIDGFFWNVFDGDERGDLDNPTSGSYGRFGYWNSLICVPNSYIFDTTTESWWRFNQDWDADSGVAPAENYGCYLVDNVGKLLAFPYKHRGTAAEPREIWHKYYTSYLNWRYSWQSHPLIETRGRRQSFQEVRALVTAVVASTITVTLTGFVEDGSQIASVDVTLNIDGNTNPQVVRADVEGNFVAEYVQVRLQVEANDNHEVDLGNFAPKVHAMHFGIKPRSRSVRQG